MRKDGPYLLQRAVGLVILSFGGLAVGQPTVVDVGTLPGTEFTSATCVSGDGRIVAGHADTENSGMVFRWTDCTGEGVIENLGVPAGCTYAEPHAINPDGSIIVGTAFDGIHWHAFLWSSSGGMTLLATPDGFSDARANGVSADGSVVVGGMRTGTDAYIERAFRWTSSTGMQRLQNLVDPQGSVAVGVSDDGSVIAGTVHFYGPKVFRWSSPTVHVIHGPADGADAVSADGTTVVGENLSLGDNFFMLFKWTLAAGNVGLNVPQGLSNYHAHGVSADGSVVVGEFDYTQSTQAVIWAPGLDGVDLKGFLRAQGTNVCHWSFDVAYGVSADGTVVVGSGFHDNAGFAGFVVRLDGTGVGGGDHCGCTDFDEDGRYNDPDREIAAFFSCLAGDCCPTCGSVDFDGDGDAGTDQDIEAFFRVLAGGNC